jgi:hypothetical protein
VGATAGAVGAGVIAAALASGLPAASQVTATQVQEQASAVDVSMRLADGRSGLLPGVGRDRAAVQATSADAGQLGGIGGGVSGVEAVFSTTGATTPPWLPVGSRSQTVVPVGVTTTLLHHLLAVPAYRAVGPLPGGRALVQLPEAVALSR